MDTISKTIEWQKEKIPGGDITITGVFRLSTMGTIKSQVANDPRVEAHAKRQMADDLWHALYGDMDRELARLERMLVLVLPVEYVTMAPDGPVALVRELQNKLAERK